MKLELTELQQITLRDVLTTAGLTARQVEDIFLLLSFKRERVQLAFYYRAQGMTQQEVADRVGVTQQAVQLYIKEDLSEIMRYLLHGLLVIS